MPTIPSLPAATPLLGDEQFHAVQPGDIGTSKKVTANDIANFVTGGGSDSLNITTVDPTVGDDDVGGYAAGNRWLNTADRRYFICQDATTGAAVWERIDNFRANVAGGGPPGVNNDDTEGYEPGSIWIDDVNDAVYFCKDATTTAAEWIQSGGGGGGGHVIQDDGTPLTQRANLNFTGAGVTVTDDPGNDATVIDIPGGGASAVGGGTNVHHLALSSDATDVSVNEDLLLELNEGDPLTVTSGQFVIEGGNKAILSANIRGSLNSSTEVLDIRWYDVTNATFIGDAAVIRANDSTNASTSEDTASAVVTPSVDTTYVLRVANVVGTSSVTSYSTGATVTVFKAGGSVGSSVVKSITTNILSADVTTDVADIADLRFTGLTVGATYTVAVQTSWTGDGTDNGGLYCYHDGNTLGVNWHYRSSFESDLGPINHTFVATATTVTFETLSMSGAELNGDGTQVGTYAQLIEWNNVGEGGGGSPLDAVHAEISSDSAGPLTNNQWNDLNLEDIDYQSAGVSIASGVITVTESGPYNLSFVGRTSSIPDGTRILGAIKVGSDYLFQTEYRPGAASEANVVVSFTKWLNAGETVQAAIYNESGSNETLNASVGGKPRLSVTGYPRSYAAGNGTGIGQVTDTWVPVITNVVPSAIDGFLSLTGNILSGFGSATISSVTGAWNIQFPAGYTIDVSQLPTAFNSDQIVCGEVIARDVNTFDYYTALLIYDATSNEFYPQNNATGGRFTDTRPFTWAAGDIVTWSFNNLPVTQTATNEVSAQVNTIDMVITVATDEVDINIPAEWTDVEFEFKGNNDNGSTSVVRCFINGDTTTTNYHSQRSGSTNGASSVQDEINDTFATSAINGYSASMRGVWYLADRAFAHAVRAEYDGSGDLLVINYATGYEASVPSAITQLNFRASVADGIGVGSRIIVRNLGSDRSIQLANYSETEHLTGESWIDGKPIYRKVIDMGAGANAGLNQTAHSITGITRFINVTLNADDGTTGYSVSNTADIASERVSADRTNVNWRSVTDRTGYTGFAVLEYVK